MNNIITPKTNPTHPVVGHYFGGQKWETGEVEIYFCDSYDPQIGFWLTNIKNPEDRKNVSEREIGGNFHKAYDRGDHWMISRWWKRVNKS